VLRRAPEPHECYAATPALQTGKPLISTPERSRTTPSVTSVSWHPRLSQKLGPFRLVQVPGSHELCFSNPKLLAQAIMDDGRD
jgi:hypothetical protein